MAEDGHDEVDKDSPLYKKLVLSFLRRHKVDGFDSGVVKTDSRDYLNFYRMLKRCEAKRGGVTDGVIAWPNALAEYAGKFVGLQASLRISEEVIRDPKKTLKPFQSRLTLSSGVSRSL